MNSSRIEFLWLFWDQSRSKYYLRTKFQDGIDKPQKCQNVCYHPTHQQQSDFLILVLYDFIVQSILSSLLMTSLSSHMTTTIYLREVGEYRWCREEENNKLYNVQIGIK